METWIFLGGDVYVKPIDGRDIYVVQPGRGGADYVCRLISNNGGKRLIGRGGTPRQAAQLIVGWRPQPDKAHLRERSMA